MDAGFKDLYCGLDMVEVWQGQVDGIDGAGGQELVEFLIGLMSGNPVLLSKLLGVFGMAGHERR